jgi:PAS domain-containing protein
MDDKDKSRDQLQCELTELRRRVAEMENAENVARLTMETMRENEAMLRLDITERKREEAALKTSEERFRTAAESLADVVYDWDIKKKVDWYGNIDGIMVYPGGEGHMSEGNKTTRLPNASNLQARR